MKRHAGAFSLFFSLWLGLTLNCPAEVLDIWHWRNPPPQGNDLRGACYGNGTFLLVGDAGALVTSSDGTNWSNQTAGTSANLFGATFGNGIFAAER